MSDWTLDFNSLAIGGPTSPYKIDEVTGLLDAPVIDSGDIARPRQPGEYSGEDLPRGRMITATMTVRFPGDDDPDGIVSAFSRAVVTGKRTELPLLAQYPGLADGRQVRVLAKVRDQSLPVDADYRVGAGRAKVLWKCTDPRIYDAALTTLTTAQATSAGTGAALPLALPIDLGGPVSGGLITAVNEGEFDAPWRATIFGPVNGPRIENVTTGQFLGFDGSLAAGETLVLDSLEQDVLLNGAEGRQTWITFGSEWFDLPPDTTQLRFAGSGGPGSMQLDFRSTWI